MTASSMQDQPPPPPQPLLQPPPQRPADQSPADPFGLPNPVVDCEIYFSIFFSYLLLF